MSHEPAAASSTTEPPRESSRARRWIDREFELVIAVLLGVASVVTAWASFQASLYDGEMAAANTQAGVLSAEAESLYLEGNQQFMSDGQLFQRLTELAVQEAGPDPASASVARETIDVLTFQSMTDEFAAAMDWADAENAADPTTFTHPQGSEDYQLALFSAYQEKKAEAEATLKRALVFNELGDKLTLNTVLLAISLFLFGVAALLRVRRTRYIVTMVAGVVTVVATVLTVLVVSAPTA